MNDRELAWEEIGREKILRDEWIDFRRSTYRYPDGRVFSPYYSFSRRDYVVIVASDEEENYLCVRQFRQGIREVTTEFPAGGIEERIRGDKTTAEDALEAAKWELREETGYISEEWTHLLTIPSIATISDDYAHVYMARHCQKAGAQALDEGEYLNVVKHTADELEELVHTGRFQQSVHVMAWLLAKERMER